MAPSDEGEPRIGLNVRAARRSRGMSLEALAGLTGRSKGWLSKIENGHSRLERRQDIAAIAEALEVSADSLVGEPAPEIQRHTRAYNFRPLRAALLDATLEDPRDIPARPVAVLAELTASQDAALRRADYTTLTQQLPGLLDELQVHAVTAPGTDRDTALRLLIQASASAMITLRHFGLSDLAWVSADRGKHAASHAGRPAMAGGSGVRVRARPHLRRQVPGRYCPHHAAPMRFSRIWVMTRSGTRCTGCCTCHPPWPARCRATTTVPAHTGQRPPKWPPGSVTGRVLSSCSAPPTWTSGGHPSRLRQATPGRPWPTLTPSSRAS